MLESSVSSKSVLNRFCGIVKSVRFGNTCNNWTQVHSKLIFLHLISYYLGASDVPWTQYVACTKRYGIYLKCKKQTSLAEIKST